MSIRARELINPGREYYVEEHKGNGLAVGALSTAIPAAAISLANFAKEWLSNRGTAPSSDNIAALVAAIAPAISAMRGGAPCGAGTMISALEAKVAKLEAEKYTDAQVAKVYEANVASMKEQFAFSLETEKRQAATAQEVECLKRELTTYEATQREIACLKEQLVDAKFDKVNGRIDCLAEKVDTGFRMTNQGFAEMKGQFDSITEVVIPSRVVCKRKGGCDNDCTNGSEQ